MATYKTPGVYVEEKDAFPPSVVGLPTAIPAFIGKTQNVPQDAAGNKLYNTPIPVSTLAEYVEKFGKAPDQEFKVTIGKEKVKVPNGTVREIPVFSGLKPATRKEGEQDVPDLQINLYYQMQMYFNNGGGFCYVMALDASSKYPSPSSGLFAPLATKEDITIINLSDAAVNDSANYTGWCAQALTQCAELGRFLIADTTYENIGATNDTVAAFRKGIGNDNLNYGAAYTPWLNTSLSYVYSDDSITLEDDPDNTGGLKLLKDFKETKHTGDLATSLPLSAIKTSNTQIYHKALAAANGYKIDNLPAGGAIAGIYCNVDTHRGVWMAPANLSLNSTLMPSAEITSAEQENLNVDPLSGKSVNAIRYFPDKGVLVWGARTLEGNSNDWRYISVRRTVSYVERSLDVALQDYVFESNNAMTWLKAKTMIESFLNGLWLDGGLVGSSATDAYFVNIGLGVTMTAQDILEGKMIISIGLAVARPAEFIILEVTQLLQK